EKSMIAPIERAIMMANIGLTPQNDGEVIRLFLPPLTEERRKELGKKVYAEGETAKISIRGRRRDAMEASKKLQKDGSSEDAAKEAEGRIQALPDKSIAQVDAACKDREKEIMTVLVVVVSFIKWVRLCAVNPLFIHCAPCLSLLI